MPWVIGAVLAVVAVFILRASGGAPAKAPPSAQFLTLSPTGATSQVPPPPAGGSRGRVSLSDAHEKAITDRANAILAQRGIDPGDPGRTYDVKMAVIQAIAEDNPAAAAEVEAGDVLGAVFATLRK